MNPNAYVPPDAAVWMNMPAVALPLFDVRFVLIVVGLLFVITALPGALYVYRLVRAMASAAAARTRDEDEVEDYRSAPEHKSPGALHLIVTLVTLPLALLTGFETYVYAAGWWAAGAYDCSTATPYVHPRLGQSPPQSNVCMNLSTHASELTTEATERAKQVSGQFLKGDQ